MTVLADIADVANSEPSLPGWIWLATLAVALLSLTVAWIAGETTVHVHGRLQEARWLCRRREREVRQLRAELALVRSLTPPAPPQRPVPATPPAGTALPALPITGLFCQPDEPIVLELPVTERFIVVATADLEAVG